MKKNLRALVAAMFLIIVAGCTGDPLTHDNGKATTADAGASVDSGHHGQQPAQDTAVCTPKCSGKNCGDNGCGGTCGTCDSDEVCNGASLCVPKSSASCGFAGGTLCYQQSGLSIMCQPFAAGCDSSGKFVSTGAAYSDSCDDGNSATTDSVASATAFGGWDYKSVLCIHMPVSNGGGGGNGTCVVRQLDGLGFTAFGNGVSSIEMAEAGWSQPVTAAANLSAMLTVGGASYFAFNAQRSDGLWAYGWDGVSASSVTKVVGNWSVDCGTGTTKLVSGPQQPTCGGSMAIGSACFWSKPGTTGVYRIVVRVK